MAGMTYGDTNATLIVVLSRSIGRGVEPPLLILFDDVFAFLNKDSAARVHGAVAFHKRADEGYRAVPRTDGTFGAGHTGGCGNGRFLRKLSGVNCDLFHRPVFRGGLLEERGDKRGAHDLN